MASSRTLFRMKGMRLLVILCKIILKRIYHFCYFAISSAPMEKAARFFLHGNYLAKVVLSEMPFLRPVQYDRMFLDFVQYGNLLHVFTNVNSEERFPGYGR